MLRFFRLARSLLLAGLLAACSREQVASPQRLLPPEASEGELHLEGIDVAERTIDLDLPLPSGVRISGGVALAAPRGIRLHATGHDPQLEIATGDFRPGRVTLDVVAARPQRLQIFWAGPGEGFSEERSVSTAWLAPGRPTTVPVDLPAGRSGVARLRIDPESDVLLARVVLVRRAFRLPEGRRPVSGRWVAAREERPALALAGGARFSTRLRRARGARLLLGIAAGPANDGAARLRIVDDSLRELFAATVRPRDRGWSDRTIELPPCPPSCGLTLSAQPTAAGSTPPIVLVSDLVVLPSRPTRRPGVLLISIDTLRPDALEPYGAPAGASPAIESLAREGVVFERAHADSSVTHLSHAALLTGREPTSSDDYWLDGRADSPTLASRLRDAGYLTAGFTGGGLVSRLFALDRGFDSFYEHNTLERPITRRSDVEELSSRALEWIRRRAGAPFFLFLHTYETHGPYTVRPGFAGPVAPGCEGLEIFDPEHLRGRLPVPLEELPELLHVYARDGSPARLPADGQCDAVAAGRRAYLSEVGYVDRALARLLDGLRSLGALDDTLVVLTSDHGEAFLEHGLLEHGLLYEENLRVPLLLWNPARLPAARVAQRVSLIDVVPTVLDLLSLPPAEGSEGRSLVPLLGGGDAPDRAFLAFVPGNGFAWFRPDGTKLLLRAALGRENFGHTEVFDLRNDPRERRARDDGLEGVPPPLRGTVRRTIAGLQGIHLDLGALAPGSYELDLPFGRPYRDWIYAFGMGRAGTAADDENRLRCRVSLGPDSELVVVRRRPGEELKLALRRVKTDGWLRYDVRPSDAAGERRSFLPAGTSGPPIVAWRVAAAARDDPSRVDAVEERTRSLGYLR